LFCCAAIFTDGILGLLYDTMMIGVRCGRAAKLFSKSKLPFYRFATTTGRFDAHRGDR
jgi:hypothetical protein